MGTSGFQNYSPTAISGLVNYYKLDDLTGADELAALNLTSAGTTAVVTGKIESAVSFNTGSLSNVGNNAQISVSNNYSISLWFYTTTTNDNRGVLCNRVGDNDRLGIAMKTNKMSIRSYGGAGSDVHTSATANTAINTWYHLVLTHTNANAITLYINGVAQTGTTETMTPAAAGFTLGNFAGYAHADYGFKGYIDEVAIFDKVLSTTEIADIYNAGKGLSYPLNQGGTPALKVGKLGKTSGGVGLG